MTTTTRRTSKITASYVAINCAHLSSTASIIPCTARTAMTITGTNGASVTLKAGEKFFLYRAASLGDGWFYIVRDVLGMKKCSCPARKPCKHEIAVQAKLAERRLAWAKGDTAMTGLITQMNEEERVKLSRPATAQSSAVKPDNVRGTLNGNQSFLDALFGSSPEMSKYRSDYVARVSQ